VDHETGGNTLLAETLDEMAEDEQPLELLVSEDKEITEGDQEASVIKFVNQVIWEAFSERATDIHLEPFEDEMRIRYRIDGVLQDVPVSAQIKRYQPAIVSRVKILSHLDIAEKRLPQDGRIQIAANQPMNSRSDQADQADLLDGAYDHE